MRTRHAAIATYFFVNVESARGTRYYTRHFVRTGVLILPTRSSAEHLMQAATQRLSVVEKVGYSLGDAAANFVFITMILFQSNFYTGVMGIAVSTASWLLLGPRVWDAFFDPIMGIVADRTRTRWGRYRPWILWTAVPWGIVMYLAYRVPQSWTPIGDAVGQLAA